MSSLARYNLTKAKSEYDDILHRMAVGEDGPAIQKQLARCKSQVEQCEQEIKSAKKETTVEPSYKRPKMIPMDIDLVCFQCDNTFVFSGGEQNFYQSKGLQIPKKCRDCRKAK